MTCPPSSWSSTSRASVWQPCTPFVQPTHEREKTPLEHIFRAILIKKTDRSQKTDLHNEGYILELDCCSSLDHLTDQKLIPEFIKKIQEAASQGLKFVGVIPQYHSPAEFSRQQRSGVYCQQHRGCQRCKNRTWGSRVTGE
ncbi:hypothetical protein H8959_020742 [Pygathrix nigripes]